MNLFHRNNIMMIAITIAISTEAYFVNYFYLPYREKDAWSYLNADYIRSPQLLTVIDIY